MSGAEKPAPARKALAKLSRHSVFLLEQSNSEIRHSVVEACFYNLKLLCQVFPERFRQARYQEKFQQHIEELREADRRLNMYFRFRVPEGYAAADLFPEAANNIRLNIRRLQHLLVQWPARQNNEAYRRQVSQAAAERIDSIMQALLDIDRALKNQKIDIAALIRKAIALQDEHLQRKGITVTLRGQSLPVFCDRGRLQDVFSELIRNAIKHAFSANIRPSDGRQPGIIFALSCGQSQAGYITITYADNGPGTTAFSAQTAPESHGVGLVRRIVEQEHGGTLRCLPDSGGGLHLAITLPQQPPPSTAESLRRQSRRLPRAVIAALLIAAAAASVTVRVSRKPPAPQRTAAERLIPENVWELSASVPYGMIPLGSEREPLSRLPLRIRTAQTGMEMAYVGSGEFTMGSLTGDISERPQRGVFVDAFYIDVCELTNSGYELYDPSHTPNRGMYSAAAGAPVVNITWWDAIRYCNWRSEQDGLDPCYNIETGACNYRGNGYRLPTEAEWEKAARGADGRLFPWGNEFSHQNGSYYANFRGDEDGFVFAAPADAFAQGQSPYGVHNLLGNVWEWCNDWFDEYGAFKTEPAINPTGPSQGTFKVIRGGAWNNPAARVSAFHRFRVSPAEGYFNLGMRCVRRP
ncbi:MAG: SUMF1/EgtB/PvdO family nonheme iron enzyme [Candidatus Omnitrophica bacterium]|nr:SUMF1/EgtB/PvdO family nonheme iron enzyme [Candidatus Omnitrophota bacterium]